MGASRFKFRAWDRTTKQFIPGPFALIGETTMFGLLDQYSLEGMNDLVMMQFTGLKDSVGTDIYEGDIVKADWGYGEDPREVVFPDIFWFQGECMIAEDSIEVIGNVHENHELLEAAS